MRVALVAVRLGIGLLLVGALQWAAGVASLPAWIPPALASALPLAVAVAFGVYLAVAFGGVPRPAAGALAALLALGVAALPLAYAYGLAQRYGLPATAGPVGADLAGPWARAAAAVWLPLALAAAFRRDRRGAAAPGARASAAEDTGGREAVVPLWSPAPALQPADPGPVAYRPSDPVR